MSTSTSTKRRQSRNILNPTQISDFFGSYPDINDPSGLFNSYISRKEEFSELQPAVRETLAIKRGGAFKHQKFAVRYLTWYDRLMLIHDPGTGKSCIITHSAELFKNEYFKNPDDPTKIRRAVILVRGPTLEENIRNEIVCKCTDRIYETEKVLQATDESVMKGNITRELKVWYDIMTYVDFTNTIKKFQREEDLDEYMSNKIFYVDEAHNVPTLKDIRRNKPIPITIQEASQDESRYETMFRAFHRGKRNKIVLATATPMINSPIDIITLMNLILPIDEQMELRRNEAEYERQFANLPLEYFERYFRGRVSYIRALDTGAIPKPVGELRPENRNVVIYECIMSEFQYAAYLQASQQTQGVNPEEEEGVTDISDEERRIRAFYSPQRQASNFVFPDGTFGTRAFDRYIEKVADRYQFRNTPEAQTLRENLKISYQINPQTGELILEEGRPIRLESIGLPVYSAKYANIVEICKESFPETEVVTDDNKGIIFIYFSDYVHGSGAIMLGLCLQANGYEEFRETRSIFSSTQEPRRAPGPCTSTADSETTRNVRINPRRRYAILSHETTKAQINTILNTLNSYENRYGHYLQVIIGSRTAREGININNAVKMIMASGSWNHSSNYQARERVFRSTSHVARLKEKADRLREQGQDGDQVTIDVKTYNMASIYIGYEDNPNPVFQRDNYDTIDVQMYLLAEDKDRLIRRIMRYIKQSSVDCFINYNRNVRPATPHPTNVYPPGTPRMIGTDQDGSPVCDYMQCDYDCAGIRRDIVDQKDWITKVLFYSEEEIENARIELRKLFSRFYSLRIEQIHQLLSNIDDIFIDRAIEQMIRDNTRVLDRMGFFGYLRESPSGVIYLEKDPFEIRPRPENTVYNSVLIGTQDPYNNIFEDYVNGLDAAKEGPLLKQIIETNPSAEEFTRLIDNLSLVSKVYLLEYVLEQRYRTQQTNHFYNAVISHFNHAIFEMPEPIDLIRKTAINLSNRGKSRGRKPNPNTQPKIKRQGFDQKFPVPAFDPNVPSERVVLHTLLNQAAHDRTSYSATTKYFKAEGKIRIFKLSEVIRGLENNWRDVNETEYIVYNDAIRRRINEFRNYYEQFPIYGIMIPPENQLHIRDREKENFDTASKDARSIYDGRVCNTWLKPDLINILYRLGLSPYNQPNQVPTNIPRQTMIDYLRSKGVDNPETFSDDKLLHYYGWHQSQFSRDDICQFIKLFFERTGRLFTGRMPPNFQQPVGTVGSIQVAPQLTVPDYNERFTLPPYPGQFNSTSTASLYPVQSLIPTTYAPPITETVSLTIPSDQIPRDNSEISRPPSVITEITINPPQTANIGPLIITEGPPGVLQSLQPIPPTQQGIQSITTGMRNLQI